MMIKIISENDKKCLPFLLLCQGYVNISFIFFTFLTGFLGFVVHVSISPYHIILAFFLTVLMSIFLSWYYFGIKKKVNLKLSVLWVISLLIFLIICGVIATNFYDISHDGQWYHQGGILLLMDGWNPIYEKIPDVISGYVQINHYPKAIEITSASITAFTHHIEDGKLLNIYLIITSFLICFPIILQVFPKVGYGYALILGIIVSFNPICIYQSLSYYVDGQLASLLTIFIFLLILSTKKNDISLYFIISFVMIHIINIKLYAIAYLIIFLLGYLLYNYINHKITKYHLILILPLLFGIIIGFNPYVINIIDHGNPFYPVIGSTNYIVPPNTPLSIVDKNSVEKLIISTFSSSQEWTEVTTFKLPFTFSSNELNAFTYPDVRINGFGPFFSGIVIFSMIIILTILLYYRNKISFDNFILFLCPLILLTVIVNPEAWWARYAPQLWLISPLLLLYSYELFSNVQKLINYTLIIAIILNLMIIAIIYYPYQLAATNTINDELNVVKNYSHNGIIYVNFNEFYAIQERFKEHNITYVKSENLTGNNITMFSSTTKIYF